MRITRATDYAIMGLVFLASQPRGAVVSIREIAAHMGVSRDFLVRIFDHLSFVKTHRGPKGGIRLTRNPAEITLLAVVQELEGDDAFQLDSDLTERFSAVSPRFSETWANLSGRLARELSRCSIADCAQTGTPIQHNCNATLTCTGKSSSHAR